MFEDKALADEAVHAVEKSIAHHEEQAVPVAKVESKEVWFADMDDPTSFSVLNLNLYAK